MCKALDHLTNGRVSPTQFEDVLKRVQGQLSIVGRAACIESIRARLSDEKLRWLAVLLAADMTAADGIIMESEREILLALARAFEVDEEEAERLVEGFETL